MNIAMSNNDCVSHNEFNSQLILIHQTMHDNQKDGFEQLHKISRDVGKIAASVEKIQAEQGTMLSNHGDRITKVEASAAANNEQRIKSGVWIVIGGLVVTAAIGAAVKWAFFT